MPAPAVKQKGEHEYKTCQQSGNSVELLYFNTKPHKAQNPHKSFRHSSTLCTKVLGCLMGLQRCSAKKPLSTSDQLGRKHTTVLVVEELTPNPGSFEMHVTAMFSGLMKNLNDNENDSHADITVLSHCWLVCNGGDKYNACAMHTPSLCGSTFPQGKKLLVTGRWVRSLCMSRCCISNGGPWLCFYFSSTTLRYGTCHSQW